MDYKKIRNERRFKILSLDQNDVLDIFFDPQDPMIIKRIKLPDEYYVDSVHYDYISQSFNFVIGSVNFPSITRGAIFQHCNEEIDLLYIQLCQDRDFKIIKGE